VRRAGWRQDAAPKGQRLFQLIELIEETT
jgi:hypothetical protein